jgi:hypothetical protein
MPARQVLIPKPGSTERRPLAIAAVRDRIVQAAVKIVLEPVFEADFLPCSFGFRPRRSAHDALQVLIDEEFVFGRYQSADLSAAYAILVPRKARISAIDQEGRIPDDQHRDLRPGLQHPVEKGRDDRLADRGAARARREQRVRGA